MRHPTRPLPRNRLEPIQRHALVVAFGAMAIAGIAAAQQPALNPPTNLFPGAAELRLEGDLASQMVDGLDRFLLQKINQSEDSRPRHWNRKFDSLAAYTTSIATNRKRLAEILGASDARVSAVKLERVPVLESSTKPSKPTYSVYAVRWPVLEDPDPGRSIVSVYGEGLLLVPNQPSKVVADVIAVPDCDQTPAQICGLVDGVDPASQFARHLAKRNCRVLVPMLISREVVQRGRRSKLSNREFVYRASFDLGRHVIGYEIQKLRSAIDWMENSRPRGRGGNDSLSVRPVPIGLIGAGEGGRLALATAALDDRVNALCIGGCFGASEPIWKQPIDRNVFGWLDEFGNAEMLSMVAPRKVLINHCSAETQTFSGESGGAPAEIQPISLDEGRAEVQRTRGLVQPLIDQGRWSIEETELKQFACDPQTTKRFLALLTGSESTLRQFPPANPIVRLDESAMQKRAIEQLDRHNQLLLRESPFVRREFMKGLKTDSVEDYLESSERYRNVFRDKVIGRFDDPLLPANARVRKTWEEPGWTGYEVVLDVFPEVIAYGVLLMPNDIQPDEKRPVVVCQHGLEGRPTDTFLGDHRAYHNFASELAKRGFITFAPQNPYLFKDRFRTLQRKANPLGKTLFSIIVPQHQQIVNWLKSLPNVDGDRIGFYGLSYGGKSAMRIPALVTDYCLSICSADFNEWVVKNASTRHPFSYVWTGEYEIFEWNLGGTFNYSEMASLICPRPFMVERGHHDGVATDQWVAYEYAKVRNLYAAQLKIGDRTEIEWFDGPHTINGKGTFDFLHRHLDWPKH